MKHALVVGVLFVAAALALATAAVQAQQQEKAGKVEEGVPALYRIDVGEDGSIKVTPLAQGAVEPSQAGEVESTPQELVKEEGPPALQIREIPDLSIRLEEMESIAAPDESDVAPALEIPQFPTGDQMRPFTGEDRQIPEPPAATEGNQAGTSQAVGSGEAGPPMKEAASDETDPYTKGAPRTENRIERYITSVSLDPALLSRMLAAAGVRFERADEYFILDDAGLRLLKVNGISCIVVGSDVVLKPEPRYGGDEESPSGAAGGPNGTEDAYLYGSNTTDKAIPDNGYAWQGVNLSGAPSGAYVTRVDYRFRVYHTYPGDLQVYLWNSTHQILVWNRLGGPTDGGYDDDTESDDDIYMNWRTTSFFNNDFPNRLWTVDCYDRAAADVGYIDYVEFRVWYNVRRPNLTLYQGTGSVNRRDYNSTTHVLAAYFSIQNNGTGPAAGFYTGVYLSPDITITTADRRIAAVYQSGLTNGSYVNKYMPSLDLDALSPALAAGTYYVGLGIDYTNLVTELNEGDNWWYYTASIVYTRPINLSLYTGTGAVNRRDFTSATNVLGVYFALGNFGTGTAGGFYTGVYLSVDNVISTSDRRIASVYQSSLAGGTYVNRSTSLDLDLLSPLLPAGTYYVGLLIDYTNLIAETNEGDNRWYYTAPIVYTRPVNLTLYTGTGAVNRRDYNTTTHVLGVYFSIRNTGTGTAGTFYTGVYLSRDNVITTGDRRVGYVSQASLPGGTYVNKSMTPVDLHLLTSPLLPGGTYYVGLIIDVNSQVAETNEADNKWFFASPIVYTPPFNLSLYRGTGSVNNYSYSTSTHVLTHRFSIGNFGTAGIATTFLTGSYLSTNNIISTTDRLLASVSQASLPAGYYANRSITVDLDLLSPALPHATYYVGCIIDRTSVIPESNEGDNAWYWTPTIGYLVADGLAKASVPEEVPVEFGLQQNYPNPFNPATTIAYALPVKTVVTLKVYDARGVEVAALVEGEQEAGRHEVQWNACGLASGLYFYRLQAAQFVQTRKLMLLK